MAGMGKRMRPHTLTTPKPLLPIAGKSIVHRLLEDLYHASFEAIDEIVFITGRWEKDLENQLHQIAKELGVKGTICYQDEPLGTAHAILCAKEALEAKVIIAFADTLFKANIKVDDTMDGMIWVQKIENPEAFGVVKVNDDNIITDFHEKPDHFISDLAIIGIYYFRDGKNLRNELQYLIDNNIRDKGEFQLTNAMENMKNKGLRLVAGKVEEWLDCGNKDATVYTNQRILEFNKARSMVSENHHSTNSVIIQPCYIGEGVKLVNSVVGPHVSIGDNSVIEDSIIRNSIIQAHARISSSNIHNSMFGKHVNYKASRSVLSIGDFSTQEDHK